MMATYLSGGIRTPGARITLLDMNEEELRDLVRKERKKNKNLKQRVKDLLASPDWFEAEGNKGGSIVRIQRVHRKVGKTWEKAEGIVHLTIGDTCLFTIDQDISVAALAAILTWTKDQGFEAILKKHCGRDGVPLFRIDQDGVRDEGQ